MSVPAAAEGMVPHIAFSGRAVSSTWGRGMLRQSKFAKYVPRELFVVGRDESGIIARPILKQVPLSRVRCSGGTHVPINYPHRRSL